MKGTKFMSSNISHITHLIYIFISLYIFPYFMIITIPYCLVQYKIFKILYVIYMFLKVWKRKWLGYPTIYLNPMDVKQTSPPPFFHTLLPSLHAPCAWFHCVSLRPLVLALSLKLFVLILLGR